MAGVIASGMGPILLACKARLAAKIPLIAANEKLVLLVARDGIPHFQGDQDVVLRPGSFLSKASAFDGAGRTCTWFRRYLTMYPRTRGLLDESDRDDTWLTDPDRGHFAWEESLADILSDFQPEDDDGNVLTVEPIRIADGTDPRKGQLDIQWGDSAITFEVEYLFTLNEPEW